MVLNSFSFSLKLLTKNSFPCQVYGFGHCAYLHYDYYYILSASNLKYPVKDYMILCYIKYHIKQKKLTTSLFDDILLYSIMYDRKQLQKVKNFSYFLHQVCIFPVCMKHEVEMLLSFFTESSSLPLNIVLHRFVIPAPI